MKLRKKVPRAEGCGAVSTGEWRGWVGWSKFKFMLTWTVGKLLVSLILILFCKMGLTVS